MRFWIYVLFGLIYLFILFLGKFYGSETIFLIKSLYLTLYLITEIIEARMEDRKNWMLNPAVLASVMTFILGYGITNLIFFIPDSISRNDAFLNLGDDPLNLLNIAMDSVIFGAVSMWVGYRSNLGIFLFRMMTTSLVNIKKYFKNTFTVNINLIYSFVAISILVRFYAIIIGVYGYAQSPEEISEAAGISQYIYLLGLLAQYSLLVISLVYFSAEEQNKFKKFLIALIIIEVFFGLISGMKSLVVMPFIIPLVAFFVLKRKIKKYYLGLAVIAIVVAYIIIEPFRILRNMDPNFKSTPKYILQTLYDAYILNKQIGLIQETDTEFFLFAFLSRNNYIMDAAKAIDYKDRVGLKEDDPDFSNRLLSIPMQAVIPRFIWSDKPLENIGLWFTQKVYGKEYYSSTAMSPFGFLYFAGGNFLIIIFFFIFGIMQNALFRFIALGSGGIIIFLGLLSSVVLIDSSVNTIFVTWFRFYPMFIILQYITFKK